MSRVPSVRGRFSDAQLAVAKFYALLFIVAISMILGVAGLISGVILVIMMAISKSVTGVLAFSLLTSVGAALIVAPYLWLTA